MNIYFYKSFLDVIKNDSNENRRNDILLALHIMRKHHVLDVYLTDFFSLLDANCLKERLCLYQHSGIKFLIMSISWVCSSQGSSLFWSEHYSDNSKINQDYEKCRIIRNKSLKISKNNHEQH